MVQIGRIHGNRHITVFSCPQYFLRTTGVNGLIGHSLHIAGSGEFDYTDPREETRGPTIFKKDAAAVGQGHCRISDMWLNCHDAWVFHIKGTINLWAREIDTEGCSKLLYQGSNASHVDINGVNHYRNDNNLNNELTAEKAFIEIESIVEDGGGALKHSAVTTTTIRNIRLQGSYGFNWLWDHEMAGDDDAILQNCVSGFRFNYYHRAITAHTRLGYRIAPTDTTDPNGIGRTNRPPRTIWGDFATNPSRNLVYELKQY